jgi:hypothetical protein
MRGELPHGEDDLVGAVQEANEGSVHTTPTKVLLRVCDSEG